MRKKDIPEAITILEHEAARFKKPYVTEVSDETRDPFRVLVSCLLSLRTKDQTTAEASARLFSIAKTPEKMARVPVRAIEKAIYPVGFYRVKARRISAISKELATGQGEQGGQGGRAGRGGHRGKVPATMEGLLGLKGVGRKTANLVLTMGYGKLGICVDTHVHRITNRWGYVSTRTPYQTELRLRKILPRRYWIPINDLLVTFGQNVCTPVSPFCSKCRLFKYCGRVGVKRSR
jgi:endonuclease-3